VRVAVYGAGAVGGYFGARLARVEDVTFIARGANLEALRNDGLRVESPKGDVVLSPCPVVERVSDVGDADVVLLGVKAWQVEEAASSLASMLHAVVVPLQNGVEAAKQLVRALGVERAAGGLCTIISTLAAPGLVRHLGGEPYIAFGELDNRRSRRLETLQHAFETAGVRAEIPDDIEAAMWRKFLMITAFAGLGSITRAPIGVIRSVPETRAVLEQAMDEIAAVARAHGIDLGAEAKDAALATLDALEPAATASMQRDIAAGRPSELDHLTGAVVRLGADVGVATPANEVIYACLLPSERAARGQLA
jgi:2-dehydropantoate 2-reductase